MHRSTVSVRVLLPTLLLAAAVAACSNFRDLFSAHANVAAEAAGQKLPAERLAHIVMSSGKGVRPTREAAEFVAGIWVDYSLLAQAAARGALPLDSASVAEAMWPDMAELTGNHWHDSLMARRSVLPPTSTDSLYSSGDQRLFQHILFTVRPNSPDSARQATRKRAEAALTRLHRGTSFGLLAAQLSEDPGSRADSGYLPLGPRGRFVPSFDSAAWALQPGQTSGLVQTSYGYHILRRPALSEVRDRLTDYLVERVGARLDSVYMDSLAQASEIKVESDAPATMRAAAQEPGQASRSKKALARYKGGELTMQEYSRWVRALPPQVTGQLRQADDSTLKGFVRVLTQNVLLLREAAANGVKVTPEEWGNLNRQYRSQLDTLLTEMGLDSASVAGQTPAARSQWAAGKVEQYFNGLLERRSRLRPMPSALATLLRERFPYRIDNAGVNRTMEIASEQAEAAKKKDSTGGKDLLRRAPGPPPVPGGGAPPTGAAPKPPAQGGDTAKK